MSSKFQPLAIVGISCLFPKADDGEGLGFARQAFNASRNASGSSG